MKARLLLLASLGLASGCGHYADFRMPPPGGSPAASLAWSWEESPVPHIVPGGAGDWDAVDALNPSVVRRDGRYWNFYSGFDGKSWHTGLATSPDGLSWSKQGKVQSSDPASWEAGYIAANGSVLDVNGEFLHWYQGGPKGKNSIGLARSKDGKTFRKLAHPVLTPGPYGSWDEVSIGDPFVLRAAGKFWLFYLGEDRARRQRLGLARSADGITWTKLRSNPILELGEPGSFDENGLGEPAVWAAGGYWWMLYTGRDAGEQRRIGLARSLDGVRWERRPPVFAGSQAWNSKVVCDPSVELAPDGAVRVWFGGGDVASPDENLHGRIGLALLRPRAMR